jgi:hypothetical protein
MDSNLIFFGAAVFLGLMYFNSISSSFEGSDIKYSVSPRECLAFNANYPRCECETSGCTPRGNLPAAPYLAPSPVQLHSF